MKTLVPNPVSRFYKLGKHIRTQDELRVAAAKSYTLYDTKYGEKKEASWLIWQPYTDVIDSLKCGRYVRILGVK